MLDRGELSDDNVTSDARVVIGPLVAVISLDMDELVSAKVTLASALCTDVMFCDTSPFVFGDVMEIVGGEDVSDDMSTFVGVVMPTV